jgi:hypothetical protein
MSGPRDYCTLTSYYDNLDKSAPNNIFDIYNRLSDLSNYDTNDINLYDIALPYVKVDSLEDEEKYKYYEFIHRFIIYLIKNGKLYILDKTLNMMERNSFHLRECLLSDNDKIKYEDINYSFTPNNISADNYYITSQLNLDDRMLLNANRLKEIGLTPMKAEEKGELMIGIMGIIKGEFKLYKTDKGDFIYINEAKIKQKDYEEIETNIKINIHTYRNGTIKFNRSKTLNTPNFISRSKETYLDEFKKNHAELLKTMTELYDKSSPGMSGGNKGKYELYSNANSVFINYNNKKAYLYESDNKIFILINNKNIYLTKKSLNYNKNLNKYFIKI